MNRLLSNLRDSLTFLSSLGVIALGALLLAIGLLVAIGPLDPSTDAVRVLSDAGYMDIRLTGYRWLSCSEDDTFRSGFSAIGPAGKPVTGAVCSGLTKGHTIRLD